jgi:hypothetical protein
MNADDDAAVEATLKAYTASLASNMPGIQAHTPRILKFERLYRGPGYVLLVTWKEVQLEAPYKYPSNCPCGISARQCEYHNDMLAAT